MKHPKVATIRISKSADKSDKAMMIKGYEPWVYYQSVNLPLFESHVDGMFSDPPITGSSAIASQPLSNSPAKRFNESLSYKLRDQPLLQVVPKMYYPSNVFDDTSQDENRNPQVQHWMHRYQSISRSFYINPPAHYRTNHVSVSLLLQRF